MKNYLHKSLSIVLVLTLVLGLFSGLNFQSAAELPASGSCGINVTYRFNSSNGKLVINGSGAMSNYSNSNRSPFYGKNAIKTIAINSGVTSIGSQAFESCGSLAEITIPDSVKSIGTEAFFCCSTLNSITIPDSVSIIGEAAFSSCGGLTSFTVPNSVKSIGDDAFRYCSELTNITLPNSVTSIGNGVFYCCRCLTNITIGKFVTSIGNSAFFNCSALKSIVIPDSVTSIGDSAFSDCVALKSIMIPNTVTRIGKGAFDNTAYLNTTTNWENGILYINKALIKADTSLTGKIVIKNGTIMLADYAFYFCSSLTSVTIPDSITKICDGTFSGCSGLKELTIPASTKIYSNSNTFDRCTNIEKVTFTKGTGTMQNYGFTEQKYSPWYISREKLKKIVIEDGVNNIGTFAFSGCSALTSISISNSITSIGKCAFSECSSLTSITIPNSVISIDELAFKDCSKLNNLTMPCSAKITNDSFTNCTQIKKITLTKGTGTMCNFDEYYLPTTNVWLYKYTPWYISKCKEIVIEEGVKNIGDYSFKDCNWLTSISIPNTVTSIGNYAFSGCNGFTNFTIPDSVTSIGKYAFNGCSSLTNVTIGSKTSVIGAFAFHDCSELSHIDLPNTVTSIGDSAFSTSGLTSITIPNRVKNIGEHAFSYCFSLNSVTLGDLVNSIGNWAFCRCENLTWIRIPISVKSIESSSFYSCNSLTTVYYSGSQNDWNAISGNGYLADKNIYYNHSEHQYDSGKVTVEPTCTQTGIRIYTCTCGNSITEIISALDHIEQDQIIKEPTCTTNGQKNTFCERCQEVVKTNISIPAMGHNYQKTTEVPSTCTEKGYTIYTCSRCSDSYYSNFINALGHSYTAVVTAPTCTEKGFTTYSCSRCSNQFLTGYKNPLGHIEKDRVIDEPTCAGSGQKCVFCERCNQILQDNIIISPLGHTPGLVVKENEKVASCTESGNYDKVVYCSVCKAEISREPQVIEALGHTFGVWEQTKAPSCIADGEEIRTCTRDASHKETRDVAALGHSYQVSTTKPTANALGYTTHTCSRCSDTFVDTYTAPTGKLTLKHSARTANAIKVQWNNVKTATGYQVQISTKDGKKWSTSATLKAGVTNYTFKSLAAGNNYKFRVRFYIKGADGKNYFSPWSATLTSPTLPTGTTITKLTPAKKAFTAQWKKNAAVNGYQVQYSLKSNFSGAKTITVKSPKILKAVAKKLNAGKYYYVRIRTYKTISKANYFSTWSKNYKVKTK